MSDFKPLHGAPGPRCTETVPRALYGPVGVPLRCTRSTRSDGSPHGGEHRATFTILGVGKALFKWKVNPHPFAPTVPRKGRRPDSVLLDEPIHMEAGQTYDVVYGDKPSIKRRG